ncbi:MAG: KAP family NTPase [Lachnospiraceae bacterium]|nr:KAP family NTPase [Lachnospiraceae bacterium]
MVENANKLVFFIDELDRCRPIFAIEMLECIKHYFEDDRIIFVMSVNKSQLIHTITKYYGNEFNSSLYLNKFFDVSIQLPQVDTTEYFRRLDISCNSVSWIKKFAAELQKYYKLSLRDTTNYFQKICLIHKKYCGKIEACRLLAIFLPILCILDIIDITQKNRIFSGNGFDIVGKIIEENESMRKYIIKLMGKQEDIEENYKVSIEELRKVYKLTFIDDNNYGNYESYIDIPADFKNDCLRICNNV